MKSKVGLWIDHRKAVVVTVSEEEEEIELVISAVEKQPRRSSKSRHSGSYEAQKVPADDSRQKALTGHLNIYYDAVIASIREADSILIFGPGEAKGELKKRLERVGLGGRVKGVETVDRMSNRQVASRVRSFFAP
jgi:hypothetical protein